jgi:hypothetical protein
MVMVELWSSLLLLVLDPVLEEAAVCKVESEWEVEMWTRRFHRTSAASIA